MRAARRWTAAAVAVALSATLAGCVGAAPAHPLSGSPSPSAASTPTPTPTVDPVVAYAKLRLANQTLRQKVAGLLMLHLPGTDAAGLRGYVDRYGLGGMIL
ncbi:MAG: glycoside hydrolase family 3 protein, partial [Leifsonia sp.]|nr:glycoside hydrolase family 3 protein [Leifsonia sp.]